MADDAKPSTEEVKGAMKVFFGEHGAEGIGLDKKTETPPAAPEPEKPVETPPEEKEKPKEETPAEPPAAPTKEAKPKAVKKKDAAPPPPPPIDDDTISRVASATAAKTVAEMQQQKPAAPAAPAAASTDGLELDTEDEEKLAEMKLAGRQNPKFADLADRTVKFWKAENDHIKDWESKNPGKKYDPEEHEDFYSKHEPQFDQAEFRKTVKIADREALKAEITGETEAKLEAQKSVESFKEKWKTEAPEIDKVSNEAKVAMITELDPELAKLLVVDHESIVTAETLAKLEEADPVAARVINRDADYLGRLIREVERLDRYPQFYVGDAKNPLHVALFKIAKGFEDKVANQPADSQVDEHGRKFMRQSEFNEKLDAIADGNGTAAEKSKAVQDLEKKAWTLGAEDIKQAVIKKIRKHAAEKIAEDRKVVELHMKKHGGAAPQTPPAATTPPAPAPAPARAKPPAVTSSGGDKTSTQTPAAPSGGNSQEQIGKVFFA